MTYFFGYRSAIQPTSSLPAMLDQRIRIDAVRQVELSTAWSTKPWSLNTSFMCWLIAPMDPMEQKLPTTSSQNADVRSIDPMLCGGATGTANGCGSLSGC